MHRSPDPEAGRGLPRVAYGDPAAGARALAEMIPAAIARAEAEGLPEVARRLSEALRLAERLAVEAAKDRIGDT